MLSDDQKQIVMGTLLGNSRLQVNSDGVYLLMKSKDSSWLHAKGDCLKCIEQCRWRSKGNYYWQSISHECLDEYYDLLYDGGKKVASMSYLDRLRDIGVMVWYGDVGCLVGRNRNNACLRTQALGETNEVVEKFFNEVNVPCNINRVRRKSVIVFTLDGTRQLFKIIGHIIPENRFHLVPLTLF